jgi:endonuclease YncB( thermonuclease family)
MNFILIKGKYRIHGYSPDGDSVRFAPDNPKLLGRLEGYQRHQKRISEPAQIRFEGIDAPETHFKNQFHQPDEYAKEARDFTLKTLGFTDVKWRRNKVLEPKEDIEGYIITNSIEKFGRPVSFVFTGSARSVEDGALFNLDAEHIKRSVNNKLLEAGLAYPTYYDTLDMKIRTVLTRAVRKARTHRKGVWKGDTTSELITRSLDTIMEKQTMLPKLFRRLVEYFSTGDNKGSFKSFLESRSPCDFVKKDGDTDWSYFDEFIQKRQGNRISLTEKPERLIFKP